MEMKYVVTDMAQTFGTLEFAGEREPIFERDKNNRQKVKLVNPKLYGRGYAIGDMGHTDYVLVADDIVAVEEK